MGDLGARDIRRTLARPGQKPPHATSRHHSHAGNVSRRLIFDDANGMARDATRPQASSGKPRRAIQYSRRNFGNPFGATPTRPFASTANPVHLPRHSGIPALYGRRVLERQAQQTGKDLRPTRMGAAGGLTGAGPPAESASQISSSNWSPLSRRALNRKPCPTIEAQNGTCFPQPATLGKCIPFWKRIPGRSFP